MNNLTFIVRDILVAKIKNGSACGVWCYANTISSSGIVITRRACSINVRHAIFVGVKCSFQICVVSCPAVGDKKGLLRVHYNTAWICCCIKCCEVKILVCYICTAISCGALTDRSTLRACSAVWAWCASAVCHGRVWWCHLRNACI